MPELSVIVPCFEEESRLARTLPLLLAFLHEHEPAHELIIVDDGSQDATPELAAKLGGATTRVLTHARNLGKGAAVRTGVAASRGHRVLLTDADLSTPLVELAALERALDDGADVAIGSRALDRGRIEVPQPLARDLLGRLFNLVIRVLGVRGIRDTQCGFKLFEGDAARILFASTVIQRWTFDVEVLLVAQKAGLEVREIPVAWRNDPASRVQVLRDSLGTLRDLLRIRLRWLFRPAPKVRTSQGVRRSMT